MDDECLCGACRSCRLALKELDPPISFTTPEKKPPPVKKTTEASRSWHNLTVPAFIREGRPAPKKPPQPRHKNPDGISRAEMNKLARQRRLAERRPGPDGRPVHPRATHGTVAGYSTYGCYCRPCTDAYWAKKKEARKQK
jgi:hypothetical protein